MDFDNGYFCGCNSAEIELVKENKCSLCGNEGLSVSKTTVEHLVIEECREAIKDEHYRICMNEDCNVVYYNASGGVKFFIDQVSVPIWFKKDASTKYACYCSKVTEEQVIEAVIKYGAKTVNEVNAITGAMKNANCKENNPLGVCCHKIIQEAIDQGMSLNVKQSTCCSNLNIETERLTLKNIDLEDREFIFEQFSDDNINKYLFDAEPLKDISEADEIIKFYLEPEPRSQHRWIIVRKSDGAKVGTCGYHCLNKEDSSVEIGYDLKKDYWENGYMLEALKEIIEFAKKTLKVKTINACIYFENSKSIKLVEKLGFKVSGSKYEIFRDRKYLHRIYSLSFDEKISG